MQSGAGKIIILRQCFQYHEDQDINETIKAAYGNNANDLRAYSRFLENLFAFEPIVLHMILVRLLPFDWWCMLQVPDNVSFALMWLTTELNLICPTQICWGQGNKLFSSLLISVDHQSRH